ncbi:MAG: hypothetical protein HY397_01155 [Candidatus Doudnabacteria bacterium]|nr:hypothetical protein [Candidatus Doudnabacteria bacterium]
MITQELLNYTRQQLAQGASRETVKETLLAQGWPLADIQAALASAGDIPAPPSPAAAAGPVALSSATMLLKESWKIYSQRFKTLIGIQLAVVVLIILAVLVFGLAFGFNAQNSPKDVAYTEGNIIAIMTLAIFFIVAFIYLQIWTQVATLFAIKDRRENIGIKESFRRARHLLGSYFWLGLVSGMVMMGGYLLFFVPGLIISVLVSFAVYVFVAEGHKGMDALLKSRDYVKGRWGSVFWRWVVLVGALIIIYVPFFIVVRFNENLGNLAVQIVAFFAAPYIYVFGSLLYENLKSTRPELASAAPSGSKTKYIALAVLGILVVPAILVATVFVSLNSARGKSRDAQRINHIRILQNRLDLYQFDYGTYPASLRELTPDMLDELPKAPLPADGKCTLLTNEYSYRLISKDEFQLTFCLGTATGVLGAGPHTVTSDGID